MPGAKPLEVRWKNRPIARAGVQSVVRAVLAGEGRARATVGLCLSDDAHLHALNREYRGKDRATDVLSFPAEAQPGDDPAEADYLGDIVISMERAERQAPRFSATFEEETARLLVHGLLHLLGYDHHAPADGRRMKARERHYLAQFRPGSILP